MIDRIMGDTKWQDAMKKPVMEVDTALYIGRKWPQIPKFFAKQYCSKCGHMLQGHIFMLSKKE